MKKKPEVNLKGFKVFCAECEKWRKLLASNFDITYKTDDIPEMATAEYTLGSGCAIITMSNNHTHHPSYEIRKTALEEIMHLALAEYSNLLDPYYANDYIMLHEHNLINKIKSILVTK